jgi:hypothetical protein
MMLAEPERMIIAFGGAVSSFKNIAAISRGRAVDLGRIVGVIK